MFDVRTEINDELFARMKEKLSESQIKQALRMSLNDAVVKGRTMVRRSVQEAYNIKASRFSESDGKKGLSLKKATNDSLSSQINAGHIPLPLSDMSPKYSGSAVAQQVKYSKGKARAGKTIKRSTSPITVEVIKGQRKVIGSAFTIGIGKHNSTGQQFATTAIFARGKKGKPGFEFSKPRYPIDSISSVSIGTAATNTKSLTKYDNELNEYASKRFVHHVERLIKQVDGLS